MKKDEQVLTVREAGDDFSVEWALDRTYAFDSIADILYVVLSTAIKAARSRGASDDEAVRIIGRALRQAAKDAGITGEFDAFLLTKKAKEESGEK